MNGLNPQNLPLVRRKLDTYINNDRCNFNLKNKKLIVFNILYSFIYKYLLRIRIFQIKNAFIFVVLSFSEQIQSTT